MRSTVEQQALLHSLTKMICCQSQYRWIGSGAGTIDQKGIPARKIMESQQERAGSEMANPQRVDLATSAGRV
jgi:hypothetical protein